MRISAIEIQGPTGAVRIAATDDGAMVTTEKVSRRAGFEQVVLARVERGDEYHARLGAAVRAAAVLFGTTDGEPNAGDAQINDVMNEIDRVAGC